MVKWIVIIQKHIDGPWIIVARCETRAQARKAADILTTWNRVRVVKLTPAEMALMNGEYIR